jgi:ABC-type polysaccharide/polyol phosphate transport system ATPase subunit
MQELLDKSGTIVFVSHSLNSVEEFCDRVLWLQDGRVMAEGDAVEVVGLYKEAATGSTKNA